ncbi:MAG: TetR/AcrR family transcriptional regulator [Albidovulum sp.]
MGKALDVFWALGYDGASLPDLLAATGLTRGSLYKAFKSKKALFLIVLQRYEDRAVADAVALLTDPDTEDGWARITGLFRLIASAAENRDRRGCLLCSAAAGPASYDHEIAVAVQRGLGLMRAGFDTALRASSLPGTQDDATRETLANLMITQYVGLRVLARSQEPLDGHHDITLALEGLVAALPQTRA